MSKKKVPTINVRRVMDDRRSATDAFVSLILREGKISTPHLKTKPLSAIMLTVLFGLLLRRDNK